MTQKELLKKQMKIAEGIYGTEVDPEQMPINDETVNKLNSLCHSWVETEFDDRGEPISWAVVMPTQKSLAERFLNKGVSEKELLDMTEPNTAYDAVYIVSVITVTEYRGKGLGKKVIEKALSNMPVVESALYFAWPITKEGEGMLKKYVTFLGKEIKLRK